MRVSLPIGIVAGLALSALAQVPGKSSSDQSDISGNPDGGPVAAPLDGGLPTPFDGGQGSIKGRPPARSGRAPRADPPGVLRAEVSDGGSLDAGVSRPRASDLELQALRVRVSALERQVQQAQQQGDEFARVTDQLEALRAQVADAESRRQVEQQQAVARRADAEEALNLLSQAQEVLAGGNGAGLGETLDRAERALSGQARADVAAAKVALGRNDLFAARQYLAAALTEGAKH